MQGHYLLSCIPSKPKVGQPRTFNKATFLLEENRVKWSLEKIINVSESKVLKFSLLVRPNEYTLQDTFRTHKGELLEIRQKAQLISHRLFTYHKHLKSRCVVAMLLSGNFSPCRYKCLLHWLLHLSGSGLARGKGSDH